MWKPPCNINRNLFTDYSLLGESQMLHNPKQFPLYSHSCHPQPSISHSNLHLSLSQQVLPSAEQRLHPPGVDPYVPRASYLPTHVEFQGRMPYYQDPCAGPASWVVQEAQTIRYQAAPSSESLLYASSITAHNSNLTKQHLGNNPTDNNKRSLVIQPIWCGICNIECNSKDVFENHLLGKRHLKNLRMKNGPIEVLPHIPNATTSLSFPGHVDTLGGQPNYGSSDMATDVELQKKAKKLLNGGAAADSVRVCTICNIACNSQEVLNKHLSGKKHSIQVGLLSLHGVGPVFDAVQSNFERTWKKSPKKSKKSKEIKVIQSAWCEVCKINCDTRDVYMAHLGGKRHRKNLQKASKSNATSVCPSTGIIGPIENPSKSNATSVGPSTAIMVPIENPLKNDVTSAASSTTSIAAIEKPIKSDVTLAALSTSLEEAKEKPKTDANLIAPSTSMIGPMEELETKKATEPQEARKRLMQLQSSKDDLETKRRKVVEGGVAAQDVRTCAICNVVCNSETVFVTHLAGKKHAAMLKKQAAGTRGTTGSPQ